MQIVKHSDANNINTVIIAMFSEGSEHSTALVMPSLI